MPPDETRKDPRQKTTDVVVRYQSATLEEFIENHAQDVSKGGMFVRSPTPLPAGTLVSFEIRLTNDQAVVAGVGRVVWKRDAQQGDRPAGMGVRFIDLEEASQQMIDRLLAARKGVASEYEPPRPGGAAAKTVLGLGSPFAMQGAADPSGKQTIVGVAPATKDDAGERARTRLGLAPAVSPASLVLTEQSSPSVAAAAAQEPQSTREIDDAWSTEEARTGRASIAREAQNAPPAAAPLVEPAVIKTQLLAPVAVEPQRQAPPPPHEPPLPATFEPPPAQFATFEREEEEAVPPASAPKPSRRRALEVVDPEFDDTLPTRKYWPWVALLVLGGAAFGVYHFREPLRRQGLLPPLPFLSAPAPAPPPASAPPPAPAPSASSSAAPSDSTAPAASASAAASAEVDATAPSPAASASAASSTSLDAGRPDAGHLDAGHNDASAKGQHGIPSASAAKAHPPPVPKKKGPEGKTADPNPY